jgi:hypothetical protein
MNTENNNNEEETWKTMPPRTKSSPQLYCFVSEVEPTEKQRSIAKDHDVELFWNKEVAALAVDAFDFQFKEKLESLDAEFEFDGIVAWHPAVALTAADLTFPVGLFNMKKSRMKIVRL